MTISYAQTTITTAYIRCRRSKVRVCAECGNHRTYTATTTGGYVYRMEGRK